MVLTKLFVVSHLVAAIWCTDFIPEGYQLLDRGKRRATTG